ncbi:MAG: septum formation family protein [Egibacteraceae bacterium]
MGSEPPTPELVDEIRSELERSRSISDLSIGDCYNAPPGEVTTYVSVVGCNEPHQQEVIALLMIQEDETAPYPGIDQLRATVDGECQADPFEAYVGRHYLLSPLEVIAFYPSGPRWRDGDRKIICAVSDPTGPTSGSVRGTGRIGPPYPLSPFPEATGG